MGMIFWAAELFPSGPVPPSARHADHGTRLTAIARTVDPAARITGLGGGGV